MRLLRRGGSAAGHEDALDAAREELDLLRLENGRLRSERLGGGVSEAIARAWGHTGGDLWAGGADPESWTLGAEGRALRETLLEACESIRRTMASVRAQLLLGRPMTELDRRVGLRRISDYVPGEVGDAGNGARALAPSVEDAE